MLSVSTLQNPVVLLWYSARKKLPPTFVASIKNRSPLAAWQWLLLLPAYLSAKQDPVRFVLWIVDSTGFRMLVTFVVFISAVLLAGVSSSDECQLGCNNLSYPPARCLPLYVDLQFNAIQRFSSVLGTDDISCARATLRAQLENFCSEECLSTFPTYQMCTGVGGAVGEEIANFTLTGLCTRHADGTFCPLKILEEATGPGNAFAPPCASGGSCDSDCQASYRNLSSRLGCCGSSYYDNPGFPGFISSTPSSVRRQFATCNVTLGGPCETATATATASTSASTSGATTMVYLSSVLVVAIACLLSLTSVM